MVRWLTQILPPSTLGIRNIKSVNKLNVAMPKTCADTVVSSSGRYCIIFFGCRQTRHRTIWVPSECSSIPLVRCETEAQPDEMPFLACEAWMSQKMLLYSPVCWKQCPTLSYNDPTMSLAKDVGSAIEQKCIVLFTSEPLFTTSPPTLKRLLFHVVSLYVSSNTKASNLFVLNPVTGGDLGFHCCVLLSPCRIEHVLCVETTVKHNSCIICNV